MSRTRTARRRRHSRGGTMVEFALATFLLITTLLSVVEIGRLLLAFTAVTNAARAATRYAIVHGANRTGTGVDGPSGPGSYTQVVTVARNFAGAGLLDPARLTVTVNYIGGNAVGNAVEVAASYPYDPIVGLLPLGITVRNTSRGVIVF